jgi:hypothetical protein
VITGCVALMVGQPVAGDRRCHVDVGPHICQHPVPVKILIASSPLGGGHRVPAQRPYVLIPDQQGPSPGQAVCGGLQRFFDLWNLTLQDARQLPAVVNGWWSRAASSLCGSPTVRVPRDPGPMREMLGALVRDYTRPHEIRRYGRQSMHHRLARSPLRSGRSERRANRRILRKDR